MSLTSKIKYHLRILCRIGKPVKVLSPEEIRLNVNQAQRGDLGAFDKVFKSFLPFICRTAQAYEYRGVDLLNLINKIENCLKEALVYTPVFARADSKYYEILIKDFIREEIIKSKNRKAIRDYEYPVPFQSSRLQASLFS